MKMIEEIFGRIIVGALGVFCIGMGGAVVWSMKDVLSTSDRFEQGMAICMSFLGLVFGLLGVIALSFGIGVIGGNG